MKAGQRGFTLIELLVVVALIAIAVGTVSLALRDPTATQLEREAERLAALLEMARAESRTDGLPVQWLPLPDKAEFRFVGLPPGVTMPTQWLGDPVQVEVLGGNSVMLGPEPIIGAQRILLHLGERQLMLATDGLSSFEVRPVP
ncbi:MAG TPA: prepilin-type N-terminal cleavage/methylation domain-containing protein [Burkholderiaceae bacterium]|jgi:general secretion pathway protein H